MKVLYRYISIFGVLLLLIIVNSQMNFKLKINTGEKKITRNSSIGNINGTMSNNLKRRLETTESSSNNANNRNNDNNLNNLNNRNNANNANNRNTVNNRNNANNRNNVDNKNVLLDNRDYSRFYWDNSFKR